MTMQIPSTSKSKSVSPQIKKTAESVIKHFGTIQRLIAFYQEVNETIICSGLQAEKYGLPNIGNVNSAPVLKENAVLDTNFFCKKLYDIIVYPWLNNISNPEMAIASKLSDNTDFGRDIEDNEFHLLSGFALQNMNVSLSPDYTLNFYRNVAFLLQLKESLMKADERTHKDDNLN